MANNVVFSNGLISPDGEEYELGDIDKARVIALQLAVQHHGFASLNNKATPPGANQVVKTADDFMNYITNE